MAEIFLIKEKECLKYMENRCDEECNTVTLNQKFGESPAQ